MKPTQKQPEPLKNVAVTGEDIEAAANLHVKWVTEADKFLERAGKLEELANLLLTERDEAIREVERLNGKLEAAWKQADTFDRGMRKTLTDLEAEKRRTAAYREGWARLWWEEYGVAELHAINPKAEYDHVDADAQKLLAPSDSGGEKDFKSQQKGD